MPANKNTMHVSPKVVVPYPVASKLVSFGIKYGQRQAGRVNHVKLTFPMNFKRAISL